MSQPRKSRGRGLRDKKKLDYNRMNSYGLSASVQSLHVNNSKSEICAGQNVHSQSPARGDDAERHSRQLGRSGQARDRMVGPKESLHQPSSLPNTDSSEYLTEDEYFADSLEDLRQKIVHEKHIKQLKQKSERGELLNELAALRAENAGATSGPLSGGPGRPPVKQKKSGAQRQKHDNPVNRFQDAFRDLDQFQRSFDNVDPNLADKHASNALLRDLTDQTQPSQSSDDSAFNLEARDKRRGKRNRRRKASKNNVYYDSDRSSVYDNFTEGVPPNLNDQGALIKIAQCLPQLLSINNNNSTGKQKAQISGIKDSMSNNAVVNKQKYPHAQLQSECMWGNRSGENVQYKDLSFGLFVAGELEIITNPNTDLREATRRQEMLKVTAYRSQYIEWSKLLHLHAAILQKIESGRASWNSNFDFIEKMVLENPGNVDWTRKVGAQPKNGERGGSKNPSQQQGVLWCYDYNKSSCNKASPHSAELNGKQVTVKHICATCYKQDRVERSHQETSADCVARQRAGNK